MDAIQNAKETTAVDLGDLLDASDDAVVTLVAGDTRLVAHRAVLMDRSPVFGAMFRHDTLESRSGQVDIADVEGPVLQQLVAYLYTLEAPHLPLMASQLLIAADKYAVLDLKATCEQQLEAQLCVKTAAAALFLAVRHSCPNLRQAAIAYIKKHLKAVMATQGWADAVRMQPEDVDEVRKLLSETSSPTPADSRTSRIPLCDPWLHLATVLGLIRPQPLACDDLGALLDAWDDAVVTLVAGYTRLVAHRAVLSARSPVFAAMFQYDTIEAISGEVAVSDVEGPVLRQLVSYLYTLRARQLPHKHMVTQLLAAAGRYGLDTLKAACEPQVAAQLSVETAAAAAVLAVRHSCESLRQASIAFLVKHTRQVMATRGWADAMHSQPDDLMEVTRLLVAEMRYAEGKPLTCVLASCMSIQGYDVCYCFLSCL